MVDSCPLAVCHPRRAKRYHLYDKQKGNYWGYYAAKGEYFYGLKAHTLIAMSSRPVEVHLSKGSVHDLAGLKEMSLSLPEGATL